jgi:CheY-like chemotaxis protein
MSRTVLVVDDDPHVLEVIGGMLEDLGCNVVTARSGLEALDQLRRNQRIAILITDINMPGMDRARVGRARDEYQSRIASAPTLRSRAPTRRLPHD